MKPRLQIAWILFAIAMVWGECIADVPRLLLPHRTTPAHFVVALANVTAVLGLTFYAFRYNHTRGFWRLFAPLYAMFLAAQVGGSFVALTRVVTGLIALGKDAPLVILGGIVVLLPIMAMAVFTVIALFRLGDWIGPTRRPVGASPQQLSLPI
ncbi:MAG: hypothetical protein QOE50_1246 [Sphingomonadales bacterium]|jgi:hypothetical protein|nr:hypothetical protein [Sphingomonadales bacterium]